LRPSLRGFLPWSGIALLAALQLNCLSSGTDRRVGLLGAHGRLGDRVLAAPETVQVGHYFGVTVTTQGSSSCNRADGAEVSMKGLVAEIVPYDLFTGSICTADLVPYPRNVLLMFGEPGIGTVRVIGATFLWGDSFVDTVTARIVVKR
jgi:hypothetical protein